MIYQFKTDKPITRCRQCPCSSIGQTITDYDTCDLIGKPMFPDTDRPDDCPLVEVKE